MIISLRHYYLDAWLSQSGTMSSSSSLLFLPWVMAEFWVSVGGDWLQVSCFCLFLQVFHCWFAPTAGQLCGQTSWPYAPTHDIQTCRSGQNPTDHAAAEYLPAPPTSRAGQEVGEDVSLIVLQDKPIQPVKTAYLGDLYQWWVKALPLIGSHLSTP